MAAGFKTATVRSGDVPATQTNFPSYVDLDRLGVTTLAEAQSIRVYADEAKTVEWAREIVSATEMHVKVPSLTSTVDIYVDWDGVRSDYATTATYGAEVVWGDKNLMWHLEDIALIKDSSGNSNTGTVQNTVTNIAGEVGGAVNFANPTESSQDAISIAANSTLQPASSAFTVSTIVNFDTLPAVSNNYKPWLYNAWSDGGSSSQTSFLVSVFNNSSKKFRLLATDTGGTTHVLASTVSATTSQYHKVTAGYDGSNLFIQVDTETRQTLAVGTKTWADFDGVISIGSRYLAGSGRYPVNGQCDYTYFAKVGYSANWITTEYNNQSDEATFWGTWTDAGGGGAAQAARRGVVMMM
jgi:hypothetical protein